MAGYPVQRGHPSAITLRAARRRLRHSGTLSGTSAEEEQMTGKIMPLRERDTSTVQGRGRRLLVLAAIRQPEQGQCASANRT
jgi:hypothetical protein